MLPLYLLSIAYAMGGGPPWRSWLPDIFGANFSENIFLYRAWRAPSRARELSSSAPLYFALPGLRDGPNEFVVLSVLLIIMGWCLFRSCSDDALVLWIWP